MREKPHSHELSKEEEDHLDMSNKRMKEPGSSFQGLNSSPDIGIEGVGGNESKSSLVSFAGAVKGTKKQREDVNSFKNSMFMDCDKIAITPPSDEDPYPSITLNPEFRASLEMKWRRAIILKVLGRTINFTYLQNRLA